MPLEGARPRDTSTSDWESGLRTGRGHISVVFIQKSVVLCHSSPRTHTQQGHQKGVSAPEKSACKGPEERSLGGGTEPRGESGQRALPADRVWRARETLNRKSVSSRNVELPADGLASPRRQAPCGHHVPARQVLAPGLSGAHSVEGRPGPGEANRRARKSRGACGEGPPPGSDGWRVGDSVACGPRSLSYPQAAEEDGSRHRCEAQSQRQPEGLRSGLQPSPRSPPPPDSWEASHQPRGLKSPRPPTRKGRAP